MTGGPSDNGRPDRPGRRRERRPTEEEMALWREVARSVNRTSATAIPPTDNTANAKTASDRPDPAPFASARPAGPPSKPMKRPPPTAPGRSAPVIGQPGELGPSTPGLDRNTAVRLKQGRLEPEARIDLHGKRVAYAHDALVGFIRRSHAQGLRCVLVITGKGGRPNPDAGWRDAEGIGVLKSMTPQWLAQPPLNALVVGVYPAHQRHGGAGAFYVYLRKAR